MADQQVVVLDYDPEWPARFADQRPPVEELLGPWLAGAVEHIGLDRGPRAACQAGH